MKLSINILVAAIAILFTSCAEYKVISIQTLKPAELSTPNNFQQPIIILGLYKGIEGVDESMAQAAIDSIAALESGFVLTESLSDSPWFQDFSLPVTTHYREDSSHLILPYSWDKVEQLASEGNADLVISLEYIKVSPEVDSYSYWDGATNAYYGYLSMKIYAYWRVYDLNSREVTADYLYKDTLVWEENDYSKVRVGDQLPGLFSAASYCGYQTGQEFAKKIAPSWMDERRFFYIRGSKNMRKAVDFADENSWMDAASLWQKVINDTGTKPEVAAKAAFNMALANELNGNFDVALNWLDKSEEYHKLEEIDWYRKILSMRIRLLERL
ncbi:MAG: DUF6340 family protein [Bacteroidales bacterium]